MVTVVNIKDSDYTIYVGRYNAAYKLPHSKFANPFRITKDSSREEVLRKYKEYFMNNFELKSAALREIPYNAILACWCHPLPCHADVLAEYINNYNDKVFAEKIANGCGDK